jgi:hypothetical protein
MDRLALVKDELKRAADSFPGLTYVFTEFPCGQNPVKLPETCYPYTPAKGNDSAAMLEYHRGEQWDVIHWLVRPAGRSWEIEAARNRIALLAKSFWDMHTADEWLLWVREILKPEKCVLSQVEDFGKEQILRIASWACRLAKPGERYFSVIEDLFQVCAVRCHELVTGADAFPGSTRGQVEERGEELLVKLDGEAKKFFARQGQLSEMPGGACETTEGAGKQSERRRPMKKSNTLPRRPRGRPPKHPPAKCRKALKQFADLYAKSNDATGAWSTVADNLDFGSGEAARKACERYQQSQISGQNGHN